MTKLLSNVPSNPSSGVPLVTVWAAVSSLVHVTSSPMRIVMLAGIQHSSLASQPGTEDPGGMEISATGWSASTSSAIMAGRSAATATASPSTLTCNKKTP